MNRYTLCKHTNQIVATSAKHYNTSQLYARNLCKRNYSESPKIHVLIHSFWQAWLKTTIRCNWSKCKNGKKRKRVATLLLNVFALEVLCCAESACFWQSTTIQAEAKASTYDLDEKSSLLTSLLIKNPTRPLLQTGVHTFTRPFSQLAVANAKLPSSLRAFCVVHLHTCT